MSFDQIIAFAVFAFVTSITPGPNNIMLTATGANVGIRRGLPHVFGVVLGFALMMFLVSAGAGGALLGNPAALRILKFVGIAVLLWLAWKIAAAGRAGAPDRPRPIRFVEAVAFQWVNPKAWLMCAAAVGGFLQEGDSGPLVQATIFAAIFVVVGAPCMLVWLGFGAAMQHLLRTDRALRAFNVSMAILLVASIALLW